MIVGTYKGIRKFISGFKIKSYLFGCSIITVVTRKLLIKLETMSRKCVKHSLFSGDVFLIILDTGTINDLFAAMFGNQVLNRIIHTFPVTGTHKCCSVYFNLQT